MPSRARSAAPIWRCRSSASPASPSSRSSASASPRRSARSRRSAASSPGGRAIELVDAGTRKELDLEVVVPLDDMREPGANVDLAQPVLDDGVAMASGYEPTARSIWPSIYPALLELVRAAPLDDHLRQQPPAGRAARVAAERARRGRDRARAPRLARARAARRDRGAAEGRAGSRASSPPRRSSSASTWARSIS